MGYWSLQVKNFGKISEAEIQLAPFTCFMVIITVAKVI